jgi:hypothetical protein
LRSKGESSAGLLTPATSTSSDYVSEAFDLLKQIPEAKAFGLLRFVIKSKNPAASLLKLRQKLEETLDRQRNGVGSLLTTRQLPMGINVSMRTDTELKLLTQYPLSYPVLLPLDLSTPDMLSLTTPPTQVNCSGTLVETFGGHTGVLPVFEHLCDERLWSVDLSQWSAIKITNEQAASLISLYLHISHPIIAFFDADLFIEDLVAHRGQFCSRLLVNTVLARACVSLLGRTKWGDLHSCLTDDLQQQYCATNPGAATSASKFLDEALKLWKLNSAHDSLMTAAAAQLLSLICFCNGKETIAQSLRDDGKRMAERMELFGVVSDDASISRQREMPLPALRATSYVAWGCFNWLVLQSHHYRDQPALYPPSLPIPGRDEPVAQLPDYMGNTFPESCRFESIRARLILTYNANGWDAERIPLKFAESVYQEFLAWMDSSPVAVARDDKGEHHVLVLRIWYHTAIMDVFRPFLGKKLKLTTFDTADCTPEQVFKASLEQLKHLAIYYRLSHVSATHSILWHDALLYVANAVVNDVSDPDWHFYFVMCLWGYIGLYPAFQVAGSILQGLLYVAIRLERIDMKTARCLLYRLRQRGDHHGVTESTSATKVDLETAVKDHDAAQADALAKKMNDLEIFEDFVDET